MRFRTPAMPAHRPRLHLARPVLASVVGLLLAGCASLRGELLANPPWSPLHAAPISARVPTSAPTWRIVQKRIGGEFAFLLAAQEPSPTPKTLAAEVHVARTSTTSDATQHIVKARAREPVGTVYFALAGARLNAAAHPIVVAAAKRAGSADRVVLTVYTDPRGTLAENRRLAERRADAVADALAQRGVERAQVIVISRPQCCAPRPLPEQRAAPYRRVDIEILTQRRVLSDERSDDA